jgi:hypothetical protein
MGTITQRPADRIVLLGHDRPDLTPDDKVKLAGVTRALSRSPLDEGRRRRR